MDPRVFLVSAVGAPVDVSSPRPRGPALLRGHGGPPHVSRGETVRSSCLSSRPPSSIFHARGPSFTAPRPLRLSPGRPPFGLPPTPLAWSLSPPAPGLPTPPVGGSGNIPCVSPALRLARRVVVGGPSRPRTRSLASRAPRPPAWFRDVASRPGVSRRERASVSRRLDGGVSSGFPDGWPSRSWPPAAAAATASPPVRPCRARRSLRCRLGDCRSRPGKSPFAPSTPGVTSFPALPVGATVKGGVGRERRRRKGVVGKKKGRSVAAPWGRLLCRRLSSPALSSPLLSSPLPPVSPGSLSSLALLPG